jgi:hypothetical protein
LIQIKDSRALMRAIVESDAGETVKVGVWRDGKQDTIPAKPDYSRLAQRPGKRRSVRLSLTGVSRPPGGVRIVPDRLFRRDVVGEERERRPGKEIGHEEINITVGRGRCAGAFI